ncbi:MAG: CusA/CzcA family heavy metal efflux RND transporter [Gammaproteobacteria bacterium]|nr:CusA/CzcA family heavy metal efflux RND transporter [Gammaproteobacteria bacterium]MDE0511782.1 CusA/CzcA family heavy metal efflux RND transporter [Gammaproteobacteria bacterium]
MIEQLIRWSIYNRFLVMVFAVLLALGGLYALSETPVDAIPDLSDVQVIIKTSYPGQAPQVVEDQVTYPLTTAMLAVPHAVTVRGYSFFGTSYVYVIFSEGTDLYWARSRVLEYLSQVASRLPPGVEPELGPDATGVGWIYEYALVDRSGRHDLSQLRSLQDWFLKYELQAVPGVAEVATVGGMVKQYQVVIDPDLLRAYDIPLATLHQAVKRANQEAGASVVELAEAEYMVRATGYLSGLEQLREIPLGVNVRGTPLLLGDVADVHVGPQLRRGIAELNGEGEVVGGIIVMRWGENARKVIDDVKSKLGELGNSLPDGVEIIETYDRSGLINRTIDTLSNALLAELLLVAIVCVLFLLHLRSVISVIISLPLGILMAFLIMYTQGVNANIMSLGGIAIAIGVMVDAAVVMIDNVHKHLERNPGRDAHWQTVAGGAAEVGRPLFFALLITGLSVLPIFTLQAQEGRMFSPLAFTWLYALLSATILAVTLVPVLLGYFMRGRIVPVAGNPVVRLLSGIYRPALGLLLRFPSAALFAAMLVLLIGLWPISRLGGEFMPELDEGDLMYMPTTLPAISAGKARQVLQQTDKLIRTVPEVDTVFGKIGQAETATDPAPMTMIETLIRLRPRSEWREGMTMDSLKQELDELVRLPGITNAWVMPIKTRIDMLATGIKTPLGIKVAGADLKVIEDIGYRIEEALGNIPGTASVYAEQVTGGRYITIDINRVSAARLSLNIDDIQDIVRTAIGGMNVTQTVEGLERYPVNIRYPRRIRDSLERLRQLPVITPAGARIPLEDVADIKVTDGPPLIKSENARLNGWVYVDIRDRDLSSYVNEARARVAAEVELPPGYSLAWSGQYEYMERAVERLSVVVPVTLFIIFILLYLNFRSLADVCLIMATLPFAFGGGVWLLYLLDFNLSIAVGIGFIALAGVAVESGIVMLEFLKKSLTSVHFTVKKPEAAVLRNNVINAAEQRLRPIMMTACSTIAGLLPIMLIDGTGSEVMQRVAAPMIGGVLSSTVLTLVVIPVIFYKWKCQ